MTHVHPFLRLHETPAVTTPEPLSSESETPWIPGGPAAADKLELGKASADHVRILRAGVLRLAELAEKHIREAELEAERLPNGRAAHTLYVAAQVALALINDPRDELDDEPRLCTGCNHYDILHAPNDDGPYAGRCDSGIQDDGSPCPCQRFDARPDHPGNPYETRDGEQP